MISSNFIVDYLIIIEDIEYRKNSGGKYNFFSYIEMIPPIL